MSYRGIFFCMIKGKLIMEQMIFYLKSGEEYIPLIQLLKATHLVSSGSEAQEMVANGLVRRNGEVELRKRAKIRAGEQICFQHTEIRIGQSVIP